MPELDKTNYDVLSFDCYGTLVDWQTAIVKYLQEVLLAHDVHVFDGTILEFFSEWEPIEQNTGGSYSEVLTRVMSRYGNRLGFTATEAETAGFVQAVALSPSFPDSLEALQALKGCFELAIISNTDRDLILQTVEPLGTDFDHITTAEELGMYKPNKEMLLAAMKQISQDGSKRVLHVAQSLFHDIEPVMALGYECVWINRVSESGSAVRHVDITPTWQFESLKDFAQAIT